MMFMRAHFWLCVLVALIMGSAVAVVYIRYLSHTQFAALQQLLQERDRIDEQWSRLLLEESTQTRSSTIEQRASLELDMVMPTNNNTLVVIAP